MNVFILSTGRCGSTTFMMAARHIRNFTSGHETNIARLGSQRLDYPARHIESDNRLSWLLGRLDRKYGDAARYVHLTRDKEKVVESFVRRMNPGQILPAYIKGIHAGLVPGMTVQEAAADYYDTVNENIRLFLKDKTHAMDFRLEEAREHWPRFWDWIGAEGDAEAALKEWAVSHNASRAEPPASPGPYRGSMMRWA